MLADLLSPYLGGGRNLQRVSYLTCTLSSTYITRILQQEQSETPARIAFSLFNEQRCLHYLIILCVGKLQRELCCFYIECTDSRLCPLQQVWPIFHGDSSLLYTSNALESPTSAIPLMASLANGALKV